jgi:DnaJ-domain-containing protein 1
MNRLYVTAELGDRFLGGLLTVARADGIVKPEEIRSLRAVAVELGLAMPAEDDFLLAEDVTPAGLIAAIGASAPFRGEASSPDDIGLAFLDAGLRLALADGELVAEEVEILREFAAAFGVATARIPGWQAAVGE